MLRNFHLAAITRTRTQTQLFQIPLHQALQKDLAKRWQAQFEAFVEDTEDIEFNAGYRPEDHERFYLEAYTAPDWLSEETSRTVTSLDAITHHEHLVESIKGIVALARDDDGEELMLFQNFSRSHVIRPGRFLFLAGETYESAERPGLTLEDHLSAVYWPTKNKLLFRSFRTTNTFLPLDEFYQEASEKEIRDVLTHKRLAPEDLDTSVASANQWFRKRIAMLRDSGILDEYTPQQIKSHTKGLEVDVRVEKGKLVFPADKAAAKRLLQFLNEEIFRGAITETLYETNSRREADS